MKIYMLTIPQTVHKRVLKIMIERNDCKRWIIGKETGQEGYKHWQMRLETSNDSFFDWCKKNVPYAHVEEATDTWEYERKEGKFWSSEDTSEIRSVRFGTPTQKQREIINTARKQSIREVDVWYDPSGNHGKTWLSIHLYELGKAMVVPRASTTAEKLSAYVCSAYRGEEFIILDIPRSRKISPELYEAIEEIKDGLVYDHRYSGRCRNIRGVHVIVFTNNKLDVSKLSHDRWRLHGFGKDTNALKGATAHPPKGTPPARETERT
nr:MAG TPA: Rep protein [Smacoviridae sp.]